jgi:hypothetical protein
LFQKLTRLGAFLQILTFEDILKDASRVRCPFQAQAQALVMLLRNLARYFSGASATAENVYYFEE